MRKIIAALALSALALGGASAVEAKDKQTGEEKLAKLLDGRVAGERWVAETTADEAILLIVGREPSQVFRRPAQRAGSPRLVLRALTVEGIGPVDCEIHAGEVVGFVGLRGAGQESVGRSLFGLLQPTGGDVLLDGAPIAPAGPRQAMEHGAAPSGRSGA